MMTGGGGQGAGLEMKGWKGGGVESRRHEIKDHELACINPGTVGPFRRCKLSFSSTEVAAGTGMAAPGRVKTPAEPLRTGFGQTWALMQPPRSHPQDFAAKAATDDDDDDEDAAPAAA
jgi:hypothetical protein